MGIKEARAWVEHGIRASQQYNGESRCSFRARAEAGGVGSRAYVRVSKTREGVDKQQRQHDALLYLLAELAELQGLQAGGSGGSGGGGGQRGESTGDGKGGGKPWLPW